MMTIQQKMSKNLVESDDVIDNGYGNYTNNDTMSVNDIDVDDDMANPSNVDSRFNDTDVDLDEEDDKIY